MEGGQRCASPCLCGRPDLVLSPPSDGQYGNSNGIPPLTIKPTSCCRTEALPLAVVYTSPGSLSKFKKDKYCHLANGLVRAWATVGDGPAASQHQRWKMSEPKWPSPSCSDSTMSTIGMAASHNSAEQEDGRVPLCVEVRMKASSSAPIALIHKAIERWELTGMLGGRCVGLVGGRARRTGHGCFQGARQPSPSSL